MLVETLKILISVPGLIFLLLIAGAILVSATAAHTRAGKIMVGLALVLFIGLGNGPAAYRILETLEKQYPPLTRADLPAGPAKIVVLTGTGKIGSGRAISAMVDPSSLYRLVEAAALFNLDPESEIVVSGNRECVEAMRAVLTAVGVPAPKIIAETQSANTMESALNVRRLVADHQRLILVTSANHMPRAVAAFKKAGMDPIPAPTDYLARDDYGPLGYLPTLKHLTCVNVFVYESLGMAWYKFKGWA
jgi:uncharacterized SAM-binding protein YcdF (DUF218 family)